MHVKVAVIGGGVMGVSSAVAMVTSLQEADDICFHIYAERFSPNTTSDQAAGLCYVTRLGDTDDQLLGDWMGETIEHLHEIFHSSDAKEAGVSLISGYRFIRDDPSLVIAHPCIMERLLTWRLLDNTSYPVKGSEFTAAIEYTTPMAECRKYIPWMCNKYLEDKVKFIERKIDQISELYSHYDIIVNCSGAGARHLAKDNEITAGRGQLLRVEAPWIQHSYMDHVTYVLPGSDYVTVGGTLQHDNWCLDTTVEDKEDIWRRCCALVPSLKKAKIIGEGVGLRPIRSKVKLDSRQVITDEGKMVTVIDNYGHGRAGVTLSWGCGQHVARLFKEAVDMLRNSRIA